MTLERRSPGPSGGWDRSGVTRAVTDGHGYLLDTEAVTCLWAGTPRFHRWFEDWFTNQYPGDRFVLSSGWKHYPVVSAIVRVLRRKRR